MFRLDNTSKEPQQSAYLKDLEQQQNIDERAIENQYIIENGERIRVPFRMIRRVTFSNLKQSELIDIPHSSRLQYRLMLKDAILKASVQFTKGRIMVIYNPKDADNLREKISLDEIIGFLAQEGIHVNLVDTDDKPYDYYKDFYSYGFNSPSIREHPPYGYTLKEWKKMKPKWEVELKEAREKSKEKFKQYQLEYVAEHPELAKALGIEINQDKKAGILKKKGKDKGFWFHGA